MKYYGVSSEGLDRLENGECPPGLGDAVFAAIMDLEEENSAKPKTVSAIAQNAGIAEPTVSWVLDQLVEQNWVEEISHGDDRFDWE